MRAGGGGTLLLRYNHIKGHVSAKYQTSEAVTHFESFDGYYTHNYPFDHCDLFQKRWITLELLAEATVRSVAIIGTFKGHKKTINIMWNLSCFWHALKLFWGSSKLWVNINSIVCNLDNIVVK